MSQIEMYSHKSRKLGITDVDPVEHNIRFSNESRKKHGVAKSAITRMLSNGGDYER